MKKNAAILVLAFITLSLSCRPASIKTDNPYIPFNAYLDGGSSTVGVILCHGRGQYPTWMVVNPLRIGIHKALGYHTLSLQMPVDNVAWDMYGGLFPDAYKRIDAAIQVLQRQKGVKTIYLMGHSMGSRMATGYLSDNPQSKVAGFIGVGIRNSGEDPLDSLKNLQAALQKSPGLKVLDVYGDGGDGKDARHAQERSSLVSDRYRQLLIPGADHRFHFGEKEMVHAVINWLKPLQKGD